MTIDFEEDFDPSTSILRINPSASPKHRAGSADNRSLHPARGAYHARLCWWLLRILGGSGGMPRYCEMGSVRMGMIADVLDLPVLSDPATSVQVVQKALADALNQVQTELETSSRIHPPIQDCAMVRNVQWLSHSAGLGPIEHEIFEFVVAIRAFRQLRLALSQWGEIGQAELPQAFSGILKRPLEEVALALHRDGRLLRCGLVSMFTHGDIVLDRLIKVPRVLGQRIPAHEGPPALLLSNLVVPLVDPGLKLADFSHLQMHTQVAQAWLAGALQTAQSIQKGQASRSEKPEASELSPARRTPLQRSGTHLLVTGAPGLGKTEWVRALLCEWGATHTVNAMELVVLADDGTALSGEDRLSHLRLTLNMLRNTEGGVIVFDEADDVFRAAGESGNSGSDSSAVAMANHRASLNRLIEDSRIPVVWIMNHPDILDPAVLRRFDTVIAFEGMPRSVRLGMLQHRLAGVADATELSRWADIPHLTPALIDRLAVVVERAKDAGTPMTLDHCRSWLRSRLPGKHTYKLKSRSVSLQNPPWDANAVQASEDLLEIAAGIGRCGSARLLLYGAPGTGKTAYAHALARMLDKPLLEQRASDLLSPWVGETEQRIQQAFATALTDDAVLFIDEVDSLLSSRDKAARNWEVSQVNELLEQLSDFEGVVVLATNRLDALDDAVLRRMDAKIQFEGLNPDQLKASFVALCAQIEVHPSASQLHAVAMLKGLTPGDFACLRRRLAFTPIETHLEPCDPATDPVEINLLKANVMLSWLRDELRHKHQGAQHIGFYQSDLTPAQQEAAQAVLDFL
ncbi:MAG: hypothetical protein CFE44_11420 [Burkholderiales bacterium PBB4]|nr:MAG: hypothetical protein CFE44_11420 [Burkholderiales bacterium PBB4]